MKSYSSNNVLPGGSQSHSRQGSSAPSTLSYTSPPPAYADREEGRDGRRQREAEMEVEAEALVIISRLEMERVTDGFSQEVGQVSLGSGTMHFDSSGSTSPFQQVMPRQTSGSLMGSGSFSGTGLASAVSLSSIYQGTFRSRPVAVRRYMNSSIAVTSSSDSGMGGITSSSGLSVSHQRLLRELHVLSVCRHEHLLVALAACVDPSAPSMLYPLCEAGSLQDLLSSRSARTSFNADARMRIALGVCAALAFLHTPDERRGKSWVVLHRNVKPSKILLSGRDGSCPKLVGLDLSAVISEETDNGSISSFEGADGGCSRDALLSLICSTASGYLDPLYNETGEINVLSDVYSFGVVLLQLVTGAASASDLSQRPPGLVARARNQIKNGLSVAETGVW
eukprot:CAMPEP_0182433942 /NCGR_PEP_ID=MMETSP1167-20130531/66569_1 /TAXON_ID=2988 /ORGANISM="Mallomonas Sp, Strain CCMP3275" /LENGTH=394 /DNA_ID=CAMNT_0024623231 /DNA_START=24 /DNA_END=1205 /DNA_ORIENTATION=+